MTNTQRFKLIEDESLRELIKTNYRQSYTILLLSYVCYKHKLDTSLRAEEACDVLGITTEQLELARKQCQIRTIGVGQSRLYGAFDLVALAAHLHCKRTMPSLKNIPSFTNTQAEEQ